MTGKGEVGSSDVKAPDNIGKLSSEIDVELSTRFLEHFSEQLYSSPQKAFEELISNGWDAGANYVDIRIAGDLTAPDATMAVLDNGASMDEEGLRQLWHIAFSPKKAKPHQYGRQVVGQFGIGKLATYVLASKLTYLCKASDGKIRRVTMDYGTIDSQKGEGGKDKLIRDVKLELYEVTQAEVAEALKQVHGGDHLLTLIEDGVPQPTGEFGEDEFCAPKAALRDTPKGTWTLVVLSAIKPVGRELKIGILRRMLEAALPLGTEMAIAINGDRLVSKKLAVERLKEWELGPDLGFDEFELELPSAKESEAKLEDDETEPQKEKIKVKLIKTPYPHIEIPELGAVTGRFVLFKERITGGVSEERGASNGFHVNVLGRVVNQSDPSFGEKNLSHAAWARFRMTVRVDGLNQFLTTDREKFRERRELKLLRAFLRRAFNLARTYYDSDGESSLPHGGDVLVQSLGVLSLNPLRSVVSDALKSKPPIPGLFDESGITDRKRKQEEWRESTADNIRNALGDVRFERTDDDYLVKFRIADSSIVVNKDHPFVVEHSRSRAEKELVRTMAMVNLLSDVYALDIGVPADSLDNVRTYRDKLLRYRAMQRRKSGTYIAKLLRQTQHESDQSRKFEVVIGDALRYLGFEIEELGKSGEPEGIGRAYPTPTRTERPISSDTPHPPLYSFSYDAKSSKHGSAATGNLNLAGVVEHRDRYKADYALVIAPGFSEGAVVTRCTQQNITPIRGNDLSRLLEHTVEHGAIPLTKLRELFEFHDPEKVTTWIDGLNDWLKSKRTLTLDIFLSALESLRKKIPDALSASTISFVCRESLKAPGVRDEEVIAVAKGLSILVPDLVGVEGDKIVVNASPDRVRAAVEAQLERLHEQASDDVGDKT